MKNKNKIWMAALAFIAFGLVVMGIGFALGGRPGVTIDQNGLHSSNYGRVLTKKPYTLEKTAIDSFSSADLNIEYGDLIIVPSDGYYLEYNLPGISVEPSYSVQNEAFTFQQRSNQGYHLFDSTLFYGVYDSEKYYINLYVPKDQYFTMLHIYNSSGDIKLPDLKTASIKITDEFGNIDMEQFEGENLKIDMGSGTFKAGDMSVEQIEIKNSYGDVECQNLTGKEGKIRLNSGELSAESVKIDDIAIKNQYGDVRMQGLSGKNSEIRLGSGLLKVENLSITNLDVENTYGDVRVRLNDAVDQYGFDLRTEYGQIKILGVVSSSSDNEESQYIINKGKEKNIRIECESGDIEVTASQDKEKKR